MARTFGNPVDGRILANSAASAPPQFRVTRPYADESMPQYGPHDGLDIGNGRSGDPVRAMDDGTVSAAYIDASGARIVRIDHGDGWSTGYAHLSNYIVAAGERVERGDKIGEVGNTGYSTAAHLHYDVTDGNGRRDPWPFANAELETEPEPEESEPMPQFGPFDSDDYERITNAKWVTLEGANFRERPTTDAKILKTFPAGETVIPHGRCKGPTTDPVDGKVWWYLTYKYAKSAQREGAFHISAIEHVGNLVEADVDADAAAAKAADDVAKAAAEAAEEY